MNVHIQDPVQRLKNTEYSSSLISHTKACNQKSIVFKILMDFFGNILVDFLLAYTKPLRFSLY